MVRAPPATFPPMNRFKHKFVGLRELVLRDSHAVIGFIGPTSIPSQRIYKSNGIFKGSVGLSNTSNVVEE